MAQFKAPLTDEEQKAKYNAENILKQKARDEAKNTLPASSGDRVGVSISGYFIGLGVDSDKYGAGAITVLQGKNMLAKFSYMDWQKLDAFMSQHADLFNQQLDKELEAVAVVKRR